MTIFQFLRLAQTLRHYGYLRFDACVADFPEKDCPVVVSAGNSELSLQLRLPGQQLREGSFRVTRMRCWRVTSSVSLFIFILLRQLLVMFLFLTWNCVGQLSLNS